MRISNATGNPEYARLRADYDDAFQRLSSEFRKLKSLNQNPASPEKEVEASRRSLEEAFREYHQRRDRLAECLTKTSVSANNPLGDLACHLWEQVLVPVQLSMGGGRKS